MKKPGKKRKILLAIGIPAVVLALGGWLFFDLYLSWISMEEMLPFEVTYQEEDAKVHLNYMNVFDIVFDTQEPVAYIGNERIEMKYGVKIRNGRPCINMRDAGVLNEGVIGALDALTQSDTSAPVTVITNGLYGQGTEEQNAQVDFLLGGGEAGRERFELYFQWYNTIHELGHSITVNHGTKESRHMVEEEQLVNMFAIAFWMYYGEEEKLDDLEAMVDYGLSNITPPVDNKSHLDYMREMVDKGKFNEAYTLNNYGWFQFNIVRDILRERDSLDLESILKQMGVENVQLMPRGEILVYPTLGKEKVPEILADVISLLRDFGVDVLDVYIIFNTDPNEHQNLGTLPRSLLEQKIATGQLIPAAR